MKREIIRGCLMIGLLAMIIVLVITFLQDIGLAEPITEQVWVLCDPDSYVTLRTGPGKSKPDFGGVLCGAELWTDNKKQNGFLHVLEVPAECDTGWISARYIVYDRPVEVNRRMVISTDGRVACRKWVNGKRTGWIYDGEVLTVYWMSPTWAVTSRGYIQSQYIGEEVVESDLQVPGM